MVKITRRRVLGGFIGLLAVGALTGGDGDGSPDGSNEDTPEPTVTASPTPDSPNARVTRAARSALGTWDGYVKNIRTIEVGSYHNGEKIVDSLDVRYDLRTPNNSEKAEERAAMVTCEVLSAVLDVENRGNVGTVAAYAYVPTTDGDDSVSTKCVINLGQFEGQDMSGCYGPVLRDHADQYKHNSYLYG